MSEEYPIEEPDGVWDDTPIGWATLFIGAGIALIGAAGGAGFAAVLWGLGVIG